MKQTSLTPITLVPLLMATFSLISMIGLLQIDKIVHGTLYLYGLQFSQMWAQPYWRVTALIFAMGWFNIIAALAFQGYVITFERRQARRFADAVRDEVMRTRIRAVEAIRESKLEVDSTPATQKTEETTAHSPAQTSEAAEKETYEGEAEQAEQAEQAKEQQTQPQQKEKEPQSEPQQNDTKPKTNEKEKETPIIVGIPVEELNAPQ